MLSTNLIPSSYISTLLLGRAVEHTYTAELIQKHFSNQRIITLNQRHSSNCLILRNETINLTTPADAILTDRSDVILTVRTADCLPILLYHPSGIIGAIHAGRKGTDVGILKQTLLSLKTHWDVKNNVMLWFGPAICKDCYQINRQPDIQYDLREENRKQAEHVFTNKSIKIIDSEHCTFHNNQHWYSYRKEGVGVPMNICCISLLV